MFSIIISPKFNKENVLCINLQNKCNVNYRDIKVCFSLIYSIISIKGAIITKQIGRYYELKLENKNLLVCENNQIFIQLQKPLTGNHNLSSGPEGIFILDNNQKLIKSNLEKLKFDKPIPNKNYEEIKIKNINPIIPQPSITNLNNKIESFKFNDNRITNFEMETSALYYLGRTLNHNSLTICSIIGNRLENKYSRNHKQTIDNMINIVLTRLCE